MRNDLGKYILAIIFIMINILLFVIMPLNAFIIVVENSVNINYQFTTLISILFTQGLINIYSWFGLAYLLTLIFAIFNIIIGFIILIGHEKEVVGNRVLSRTISLVNTFIASLPIVLTVCYQLLSTDKANQLWWYSFFSISNILIWGIIKLYYDIKTDRFKVSTEM